LNSEETDEQGTTWIIEHYKDGKFTTQQIASMIDKVVEHNTSDMEKQMNEYKRKYEKLTELLVPEGGESDSEIELAAIKRAHSYKVFLKASSI